MTALGAWRVLVLCVGAQTALVRARVVEHLHGLGFSATVYDQASYPANVGTDIVSSCVEAIHQTDIVIALLDEHEGTEVDLNVMAPATVRELREWNIVVDGRKLPTVFQVEVLSARMLDKPLVVLAEKGMLGAHSQLMKQLADDSLRLMQCVAGARPATELMLEGSWDELAASYDWAPQSMSLRHAVFVRELRHGLKSWMHNYSMESDRALVDSISDVVGHLPNVLVRVGNRQRGRLLDRARPPFGPRSVGDLLRAGLILEPPCAVLSGEGGGALIGVNGAGGQIRDWVLDRRSVMILGEPGLGKSTTLLVALDSLAKEESSGAPGLLFARWRDLKHAPGSGESLVRGLLGQAHQRAPWPSALDLPNMHWVLVLDGLDESPLAPDDAVAILTALPDSCTVLASCRVADYDRYFAQGSERFDVLVRLIPWSERDLSTYADRLEANDEAPATALIRSAIHRGNGPGALGYPLWLNMLTFLAADGDAAGVDGLDDYQLIRRATNAVAHSELRRRNLPTGEVEVLESHWSRTAWEVHIARRAQERVGIRELASALGLSTESVWFRAVVSTLNSGSADIGGFLHEVVHDHWLALHIADGLQQSETSATIDLLRHQRSAIANEFIRRRLVETGRVPAAADALRAAFNACGNDTAHIFVKNQILYFVGKLDSRERAGLLLGRVWRDTTQHEFVRYSAAFAGAKLGVEGVEEEYFEELRSNAASDELNRGYHLFYYGDVDVSEDAVPYRDHDNNAAVQAMRALLERLQKQGESNVRVRRIELFTLRRFLETGRVFPLDRRLQAAEIVRQARAAAVVDDAWNRSVVVQCDLILEQL